MKKVKSGLSGRTTAQTVLTVRYVLTQLNGNPHFPNLPYSTAELEADVLKLDELEQQFNGGNRSLKALRDEQLLTLRTKITVTVSYVNSVAKGDLDILNTSGFELVKERTAQPAPGNILKIEAINEPDSGSCKVAWSGAKGRSFYVVQMTQNPDIESTWKEINHVTATRCRVFDLSEGSRFYFRVCAVNSAGRGEWSDIAQVMAA